MKIDVLCTDRDHPVHPVLVDWAKRCDPAHVARIVDSVSELGGGDILFLVSAGEIIPKSNRAKYRVAVVLHASDLPRGRGWSPVVWQILEGKSEIVVTALEAEDKVDSGAILAQRIIMVEPHELFDEINAKLFDAEIQLMDEIVRCNGELQPRPQRHEEASYYRKRTNADSRIDPDLSIAQQFDLLRVCDANRYPAFFDLRGHRFRIRLEKIS